MEFETVLVTLDATHKVPRHPGLPHAQLEQFGRDYAEGKIGPDGKPVQQVRTQPAQPQTPPAQQVADTPVPGSGRNTSAMPATDNFALMLQDAMNKRGIK